MSRKPDRAKADWKPSPACEDAFANIIETAHRSAAAFLHETPVTDPLKHASPCALHHAGAMLWFLCRIDPKDMVALASGPGSFADFDYRPFPPVPRRKSAAVGDAPEPAAG